MIAVRIANLPSDSSLHVALGGSGWTLSNYLMAHLFQATSGEPYPGLPEYVSSENDPVKIKKVKEWEERAAERQRKISAGEIPLA
jgi:hypothetical protein